MRIDDLTLEVRDRDLKRVGQITAPFMNAKATLRWCAVGEWSLTLPGDHPMVPHLLDEGSGVLLTGPDGQIVHPTEYTAWAETRRNMVAYSKAVGAIPTGWAVAYGSYDGDWAVSTTNGASTPYIFAGRAQEAIATGEQVAGRITVRSDSPNIQYVRVNFHQRTGNVYFTTGPNAQVIVPVTPGVPVDVDISWIATKDIPADDLDISVVPCLASGAFLSPLAGSPFRASYEIISRGTSTGAYFNGSSAPTSLAQYRWLGAVNASMSVEDTRSVSRAAWSETVYGPIMSGPTVVPARKRDSQNPDGTYTFTGVTDEIHLNDALAYPQPSNADVSTQNVANDVRSAKTETLMREYVDANVGASAPVGRRRGIRSRIVVGGADATRGVDAVKSPRFQNLLELLREIVLLDPSIGFRVVQVDDVIEFQVLDSRDRTDFVRFDVENGTLTSEEVQSGGPSVTYPIVAGQGEGTERTIISRTTPEAIADESLWTRVIERFIDQRDTDDLLELQQSGDEALEEGRGGTSVKVIPADDTTMQLGVDWRQGDRVTVVVTGIESETAVTEVAILMNSDGVRAGAALGDVTSFTKSDSLGAQVEAIDARVANLERAGGTAERLNGKSITDWNDAVEPGFYYGNNAANAAYSGMVMGFVVIDGAGRIVQEAFDPANLASGRARRIYSTTWGGWVTAREDFLTGTASKRASTTSSYMQRWLDTDGTEQLWIGDRSGGWRLASGRVTGASAAWDGSGGSIWARSANIVIPTTLLPGETLAINQESVGSGFGLVGASAIPAATTTPIVNPTVQVRFMQFLAATTQAFVVNWEIIRSGV